MDRVCGLQCCCDCVFTSVERPFLWSPPILISCGGGFRYLQMNRPVTVPARYMGLRHCGWERMK